MIGIQLVQAPSPHVPQNLFRAIEECDNDVTFPETCRINPWWPDELNVMNEDQYAWFLSGWVYTEGEIEQGVLPQPLKVNLYIDGESVHLNRYATGAGIFDCGPPDPELGDCVGPVFRWYAAFEPYYFEPGTHTFYVEYSSFKDPDGTFSSPLATLTVNAV
ncbi:MAG: hypothetical protein ACXACX_07425 [Candidatus Hodarchaeales archaeon]